MGFRGFAFFILFSSSAFAADAVISYDDAPISSHRLANQELFDFQIEPDSPDPLYSKQKALQLMNWLPAIKTLHLEAAQKLTIGVIDHDHVAADHPDLRLTFDQDSPLSTSSRNVSHGNFVAGIIAAHAGNSLGISGAAGFNVEVAYRSADTEVEIVNAIENLATRHVRLVNISLGIKKTCGLRDCQIPIIEGQKIKSAIRRAVTENQMLFVISAGNSSEQTSSASLEPGVIVVGAINEHGAVSDYSNYGTAVSIYAYDTQVWGTTFDGYKTDLGTSFTTPLVTSAAALAMMYLDSHGIAYSATQLQQFLLSTARPQSSLANKSYVAGSIDYLLLARALLETHDSLPASR